MKLLFLHSHAEWRGGAPHSIATWARGLRERGHCVTLVAPAGTWLTDLAAEGFETRELPRTERLGGLLEQATPANAARLWGLLRAERPDRVQTFQYGTHLLARTVCEPLGIPWVHAILGPLSPGQAFRDGVITSVAPEFAADAALRGAGRVLVARGRIDLRRFQPLPTPPQPAVLGFASRLEGRLIPVARLVLDAFARLETRPVQLLVAGDGPGLTELRQRAPPGVQFVGQVREIREVLQRCHVWLAAGRTLIEGLASRRACVAVGPHGVGGVVSDESLPRIAAFNFGGRHVPTGTGGPETLARLLDALLASPEQREVLADSGRNWVARHLGVEAGLDALEAAHALAGPTTGGSTLLWELGREKVARVARRLAAGR